MELKQIENVLNFSNSLENQRRNNFGDLLKLVREFGNIYNDEIAKLPYHINLIDELHADENSHSRIFAKLLRYCENTNYPFLEKFLNDVCNFNLSIEKPEVKKVDSCGRIDIPIFDRNYVVVIENKVTDKAPDQNNSNGGQLARYIETIQDNYNRKLEEIYVVYTPKYAREPSEECWINKNNFSYESSFKERFNSISYRDDIYPWLKNEILPNINNTDIYLSSAIEQYVDYLEGLFSLRTTNKEMNMKLQEYIKKELGIDDGNPEEATEILSEKEIELYNAINQIQQLKSKYKRQIVESHFIEWEKLLQIDFPNLKISGDKFKLENNVINLGVKFSIADKQFIVIIESNNCDKSVIYFGIGRQFASNEKHIVPESLQKILVENQLSKPEKYWYGWKYTSLENGYVDLKNLINQITTANF